MTFSEVVEARRSVRVYDTEAPFDDEAVATALKHAILAPNSNNLQLWEFYRVKSTEKKDALARACFSQPAASTARELVVVVARPDLWQSRNQQLLDYFRKQSSGPDDPAFKGVMKYYGEDIPRLYETGVLGLSGLFKKWRANQKKSDQPVSRELSQTDMRISAHRTAALAAQTFMLSIKSQGYDSCPMEGFDSKMVKEQLGLPEAAEINMVIGVGPGKEEGVYGPRYRLPIEEVVFEI